MPDLPELDDLLDHLARTRALDRRTAAALIDEVLCYFSETPEAFVRRRHRRLQAEGLDNRAIYARLADELQHWRFRSTPLTERQIRRLIYG